MKLNFRKGSAFASKKAKKILADKKPEDFRKITVIRHAAIGDFMNIRPFLINLKKFFPNAYITLSVDRNAMYGIPKDLIDDIHIIDKRDPQNKNKKTNFFQRRKQIKQLPEQDIIFDLTDSTFTTLQIMMSKAKLKIGYPYRSIRRLFYDIATLRSDLVLESHSIQHMINLLGAQDTKLEYGYENKYPKNIKKQIIYFPGAAVQVKCWEDKKFIQLIDSLSKKYPQYEHVILQGIKEDEKFENIYQPFVKKQNVLLQPKMECDNVMQFISNASCLISNDTGIRNIAIALETPTVGIFFATAAFRYWPRDEKHEAVFNVEYTSPDVNDVYQKTTQIMNRLYGVSR